MTMHAIITLSNSEATRLTPPGIHSGMDITIQNINASGYVFLGGPGVTTEDYGYRLLPGFAWSVELPGMDSLYAIADVDGSQIATLKTSLESGN